MEKQQVSSKEQTHALPCELSFWVFKKEFIHYAIQSLIFPLLLKSPPLGFCMYLGKASQRLSETASQDKELRGAYRYREMKETRCIVILDTIHSWHLTLTFSLQARKRHFSLPICLWFKETDTLLLRYRHESVILSPTLSSFLYFSSDTRSELLRPEGSCLPPPGRRIMCRKAVVKKWYPGMRAR